MTSRVRRGISDFRPGEAVRETLGFRASSLDPILAKNWPPRPCHLTTHLGIAARAVKL